MTPLEQATQAAIAETNRLRDEIKATWQQHKEATERETILRGRIEQLEAELTAVKEKADYNLRCAVEIATQMHNVGMFVSDALHTAKTAVVKGNGKIQAAYDAVEKALSNDSLQREAEPKQLPDNQVR